MLGIEIDTGEVADILTHDAAEERIAAADLQHAGAALQHLGDELVARERKRQPLRIVEISPARHQAKPLKTLGADQVDRFLVRRRLVVWIR